MNLVITGLARHGKDTVCEHLQKVYGFTFESSSRILLSEVIYPVLKEKYNYSTEAECYNDRVNHRDEWFDLLCEYNKEDKARLGKLIFSKYSIYCGLRNKLELEALRAEGLVDKVIWVDAKDRLSVTEDSSSITITEEDADIIITNNSNLEDLYYNINKLVRMLQ